MSGVKILANKGFTLIEIMIAGSLMTVSGLAMMSLITANSRAVSSVTSRSEFSSLVSILQNTLSDSANCKNVLGTFTMTPPVTPGVINPPQAISPIATHGVSGATGIVIAQTGPMGAFDVTNIEFTSATPMPSANQYLTTIHLAATKSVGGGGALGGKDLVHDFQVLLTIDPAQSNLIVGCAGQASEWKSTGTGMSTSSKVSVDDNFRSSVMQQAFTVGGTSSQFCPVLIKANDLMGSSGMGGVPAGWLGTATADGTTEFVPPSRRQEFEIYRSTVHENIPGGIYNHGAYNNGTFDLVVEAAAGYWGEGRNHIVSYYYEPEIWQGNTYSDPVGDIIASYFGEFVVVYLRGGATYQVKSLTPNTGKILLDGNPTCVAKSAPYENYPVITTANPSLVRSQKAFPQGISIGWEHKTSGYISPNGTGSVSCSAGKQVLGWGCRDSGNGNSAAYFSYPSSPSTVYCGCPPGANGCIAHVICGNVR